MTKQYSTKQKITFSIIISLFIILVLWGIGELVFRTLVAVRAKSYPTATTEWHSKLGWTAKPNFKFDGKVKDGAGVDYEIHFSTNENGF